MAGRPRRARSWHRRLGVLLVLPLLLVSLTGVLLNHTVGLRLDEGQITWAPVLKRYGMTLSGEPVTYATGDDRVSVSQWSGECFLNALPLETGDRQLIGAVAFGDQVAVAFDALPIQVYQRDGLLAAEVDDTSYPGEGVAAIGRTGAGRLAVRSVDGSAYALSEDLFECSIVEDVGIAWSETRPTPETLTAQMREAYRGEGVPWSRLLLDLHSGRFFGSLGPWLLDLSVLGLLVLIITGLKLSWRSQTPRS